MCLESIAPFRFTGSFEQSRGDRSSVQFPSFPHRQEIQMFQDPPNIGYWANRLRKNLQVLDAAEPTEVQLLSFVCSTGGKGSEPRVWNIQNLGAVPPYIIAAGNAVVSRFSLIASRTALLVPAKVHKASRGSTSIISISPLGLTGFVPYINFVLYECFQQNSPKSLGIIRQLEVAVSWSSRK